MLHFETEPLTLTPEFDMETNVNNTTEPQHDAKLPVGSRPSAKYRLMIYFAHSTMVMYAKTIVSHEKMSVGEFMEQNKDVVKRVFDEGLSIMEYELSHHQLERASLVYLQSKYFPSSVYEKDVYRRLGEVGELHPQKPIIITNV